MHQQFGAISHLAGLCIARRRCFSPALPPGQRRPGRLKFARVYCERVLPVFGGMGSIFQAARIYNGRMKQLQDSPNIWRPKMGLRQRRNQRHLINWSPEAAGSLQAGATFVLVALDASSARRPRTSADESSALHEWRPDCLEYAEPSIRRRWMETRFRLGPAQLENQSWPTDREPMELAA